MNTSEPQNSEEEKSKNQNPIEILNQDEVSILERAQKIKEQEDFNYIALNTLEKSGKIDMIWETLQKKLTPYLDPEITQLGINPFSTDLSKISQEKTVDLSSRANGGFLLKISPDTLGIHSPLLKNPKVVIPAGDEQYTTREMISEIILRGSENANYDIEPKKRFESLLRDGTFGDLVTNITHEVLHTKQKFTFFSDHSLSEAQAFDLAGLETIIAHIRKQADIPEDVARKKAAGLIASQYKISSEKMEAAFDLVNKINGLGKAIEIKTQQMSNINNRASLVGKYGSSYNEKLNTFPKVEKEIVKISESYEISQEEIENGTRQYLHDKKLRNSARIIITNEVIQDALHKEISSYLPRIEKQNRLDNEPLLINNFQISPDNGCEFLMQTQDGYVPLFVSAGIENKIAKDLLGKKELEKIERSDKARIAAGVVIFNHLLRSSSKNFNEHGLTKFMTEVLNGVNMEDYSSYPSNFIYKNSFYEENEKLLSQLHLNYIYPFSECLYLGVETCCHTLKTRRLAKKAQMAVYNSVGQNEEKNIPELPEKYREMINNVIIDPNEEDDHKRSEMINSVRKIVNSYAYEVYKQTIK